MKRAALFLMAIVMGSVVAAQARADEMAMIKGGDFMMGSSESEFRRENDETRRRVVISDFQLARHEVTQREYRELMKDNPSNF